MTSEWVDFGKAVRLARTAKGMTLEMLAHEALGNQDRKSYVSAVEKGRKRLSALTVQKFATFLELDDPVVARLVTGAVGEDEPITQVEVNADAIAKELEEVRKTLKLSEALAVSLAYEFAEGNPTDLTSALNELRRAFEVAAKQPTTGNLDADVNAVLEEVRRLNADDRMVEAKQALREALERKRAQQEQVAAEVSALIQSGIDQAVLMRDVEEAARLEVEQVEAETPDVEGRFEALLSRQNGWYVRGRDLGLAFDLEVSIAVANECVRRSRNTDEGARALNDLAISLSTKGERDNSTVGLQAAVSNYRAALKIMVPDQTPLNWSAAQNNLGNALALIGERESDTSYLKEAVDAFSASLIYWKKNEFPMSWATAQNNLGDALRALGERETGTDRLREAIVACRNATHIWTREEMPMEWAGAQNNVANCLAIIGTREKDTKKLFEAIDAYDLVLEHWHQDALPLNWAGTTMNLGLVYAEIWTETGDVSNLKKAINYVRAAREVYDQAGAAFYLEQSNAILARLEAKL